MLASGVVWNPVIPPQIPKNFMIVYGTVLQKKKTATNQTETKNLKSLKTARFLLDYFHGKLDTVSHQEAIMPLWLKPRLHDFLAHYKTQKLFIL